MSIETLIDGVLAREGGYVNDPKDAGGETNFGITVAVARAAGWAGAMRDLPVDLARSIYANRYVVAPGFLPILDLSERIGDEVVDTGINMGPVVSTKYLQRALNALNREGKDYGDVFVDGQCGPGTVAALGAFLRIRQDGEVVLLKALNCLQGARYIELCEARQTNEAFLYGWLKGRVSL